MKKYSLIIRIVSSIFIAAYYSYSFITNNGNLYVNIVLASLFILYTIFQFATIKMQLRTVKKYVKKSYSGIKILLKTFTLGATIYGLYTATIDVDPISIVLATLMVIIYVAQLVIEIAINLLWPKARYVIAGVMKDAQSSLLNKLNVLGKLKGDDPIELPLDEFEKEIKELEPLVQANQEKKKQKRKETWKKRVNSIFKKRPAKAKTVNEIEYKEVDK